MSVVALLDCDEGRGSVQDLIDGGRVVAYDCTSFEKAEQVYWALYYGKIKADLVVVDSLSQMVTTLLQEIAYPAKALNPQGGKTMWSLYKPDRDNRKIYQDTTFLMRPFITKVRDLPIPSIFTVHEVEREDPLAEGEAEKRLPSLPPKIMEHVLARSDLVLRLFTSMMPFTQGNARYPVGTRCLQLKGAPGVYTGTRLTPSVDAALEPVIPEPTLEKLYYALQGKLPKSMTIYGLPKVGKSVFACTLPV